MTKPTAPSSTVATQGPPRGAILISAPPPTQTDHEVQVSLHELRALLAGLGNAQQQMMIALAAYASYFVNATQFVLKLRAARRDERLMPVSAPPVSGSEA